MSRSSGQVTHVLLTRSRLCPRPKPGSSLHLHVLGTPPAFVLSQDQTLREELHGGGSSDHPPFTKSRQRKTSAPTLRRRKNSGPALAGQAPAPTTDGSQWVTGQRPAGSPMYTKGSRRKTGSILAPPKSAARRRASSTASNLDTHSTEGTVEVRMLLSFQRPPHLQREGESLSGHARSPLTGFRRRRSNISRRSWSPSGAACSEAPLRKPRTKAASSS